jgi:hypothetical protein
MYSKNFTGGEGASTLAFGRRTVAPTLVVLPAISTGSPAIYASQEIYHLAYEWALAMLRPGGYELANRLVLN